jgi:hypothetical protein
LAARKTVIGVSMKNNPDARVEPQQLASDSADEGFRSQAAAVVFVGDNSRRINSSSDADFTPVSDVIGTDHDVANAMIGAGCSAQYPVPGRSAEYNFRVAGHEIGHCVVMRALSAVPISFVEITRGDGYEGRCCGAAFEQSQHNLEDQTETVINICSRIEKMAPGIGASRIESAEFYVTAQTVCMELVAGSIAEQILFPDQPPLRCEHDRIEARAVAALACASPKSVDAILHYAESEARNLIHENMHVAVALVEALVDSKTGKLTGAQVDAVIEIAVARNPADRKRTPRPMACDRTERCGIFRRIKLTLRQAINCHSDSTREKVEFAKSPFNLSLGFLLNFFLDSAPAEPQEGQT